MRILLTGHAGFIGFHACRSFLAAGHEVLAVDSFNDYYDPRLKEFRQEVLARTPGKASFRRLDLADAEATEGLFAACKPEVVVHLAAQAGVRYSLDNPRAYLRANVDAFLNILEGCRHHGVRRLAYASSSSVYGGIEESPFSETMRVDRPISLYAATKLADEHMAHAYSHLFGFQAVGLRFFTVYGPFGRPDMALWLFTEAILAGRPIRLFNAGRMRRDFTYVDDIVSGVVAAAERDLPRRASVYNLGNHRPEELGDFVACLERHLGRKARREDLPMQPGDVPATCADIGLAQRDLGFAPRTRLEEGVGRFTAWYLEEWLPRRDGKGVRP